MQVNQLPIKFNESILNAESNGENKDLFDKLNAIFDDEVNNRYVCLGGKEHIRRYNSLPNYVIKMRREDGLEYCADQHIYGLRRNNRMEKIIVKNRFTHTVLPKHYLYQHRGEWYVIAEYLNLTNNRDLKLSAEETKELTTLCYEGKLGDINNENIIRTADGKVAAVDPEALSRGTRKKFTGVWNKLIGIKSSLQFSLSITNSSRIALTMCKDEQAIKQTCKIQNINLLKFTAKKLAIITLAAVSIIGIPVAVKRMLILGHVIFDHFHFRSWEGKRELYNNHFLKRWWH